MTEDIADYIERKRYLGVHGNHLEIQALSEMYNRPIQIYCYSIGNSLDIDQFLSSSGTCKEATFSMKFQNLLILLAI